jgi:type I restriction enzyme M protein
MTKLISILKDSNYSVSLFTKKEIESFEKTIFEKAGKLYINCLIREKEIQLKPEEVVRQLYLSKLLKDYGYPKKSIKLEHAIRFGRDSTKSADIVIFDKDRPTVEYIIVEVKKPKLKDGKEQLKSYCNATGAPIAVWTNGEQISRYNRKDPNYFEDITEIPKYDQSLEDILTERYTWKDLVMKDKVISEGKSLKTIILEMEDEVLANAGVDVFEELFKLIFAKLYDESKSKDDKKYLERDAKKALGDTLYSDFPRFKEWLAKFDDSDFRVLDFRNKGQSAGELKTKIQKIFDEAKTKWQGVFSSDSKIQLSPSHLSVCVSSLHDIKLFNSNLQVIDEAFEYLVNKSSKGEKGQYFTPRHVIDMCVKMLNPKRGEYMIDTASGSCGFPVHTIFHLTGQLFQNADIPESEKENVLKIFGIDFDERAVRVARTLNLIAGDGETNVLYLNSLDYKRWSEMTTDPNWRDTYGKGLERMRKLSPFAEDEKNLKEEDKNNQKFDFDILMANPPFSGDIKESSIIHNYDLGYSGKKTKTKVSRDVLFIERNLDFVKAGGRLALVLPQGRFNNTSDKEIREYIADKARILAVVGLHGNTFKPHTGTKTSVLFLQKWDDELCPKVDDYPIFFATSEKSGKDNSGDYVFIKNEDGSKKIDKFGHFIIDHDLHNHAGELKDGVAEAFIQFAKSQKLSFSS